MVLPMYMYVRAIVTPSTVRTDKIKKFIKYGKHDEFQVENGASTGGGGGGEG